LPQLCEFGTSVRALPYHGIFEDSRKIEVAIAEVKSSRCALNGPWTRAHDENLQRVLFALGVFPRPQVNAVAQALYASRYVEDDERIVRLFAIGSEENTDPLYEPVVQVTWTDILQFIYQRFRTHDRLKSQHEQWDACGRALYKAAMDCSSLSEFRLQARAEMGVGQPAEEGGPVAGS